jgi:hypothetical protein
MELHNVVMDLTSIRFYEGFHSGNRSGSQADANEAGKASFSEARELSDTTIP